MAQEDKGLVLRGLLLLTAIGALVAVVLAILFYRPAAPNVVKSDPPEFAVAWVALPGAGAYPAGVNWHAFPLLEETLPSAPGWEIRYNAAVTLARRGSKSVPWDLILEMLDEKQQRRNCRVRTADGKDIADEEVARAFVVAALRAVALWHEKRPDAAVTAELQAIRDRVNALAESSSTGIKAQAEKTREAIQRK